MGTPLCKKKRYVPVPQRVGFLHRFCLKTGIDLAHFGLEEDMVFKGTTGMCERFYCVNSKRVRKKEREICEFERNLFCCCSNLSNDDIIS